MIRRMSVLGALFAVAFASQSAIAAPAGDIVLVATTPVTYGDLDLRTPAGQNALAARLSSAATHVCGDNPVFHAHFNMAPHFVRADFERCRIGAQQGAYITLQQRGYRIAANR